MWYVVRTCFHSVIICTSAIFWTAVVVVQYNDICNQRRLSKLQRIDNSRQSVIHAI